MLVDKKFKNLSWIEVTSVMIFKKLTEAGLTKQLDTPVWKTKKGVTVSNNDKDKTFDVK